MSHTLINVKINACDGTIGSSTNSSSTKEECEQSCSTNTDCFAWSFDTSKKLKCRLYTGTFPAGKTALDQCAFEDNYTDPTNSKLKPSEIDKAGKMSYFGLKDNSLFGKPGKYFQNIKINACDGNTDSGTNSSSTPEECETSCSNGKDCFAWSFDTSKKLKCRLYTGTFPAGKTALDQCAFEDNYTDPTNPQLKPSDIAKAGKTSYFNIKAIGGGGDGPVKCDESASSDKAWTLTNTNGEKTFVAAGGKTSTDPGICKPGGSCPYPDLCKDPGDGYTSSQKTGPCIIKKTGGTGICSTGITVSDPWCLASTTKIPKIVNGNVQYVEVKDLKDGDMIRTTRGDYPLSHIMNTTTFGPHTYVKVEQGALGNNLPSQDLYITREHSFSLGYYKNSILNRNIYDPAQDDMVYLHITAGQLANKLPGITQVQKEFDSMFNLVFDEHVSLDIYGLEVMMHHPKGNPYTLPEEKYQDKSKINNKVQKPLFVNYDMLESVKPDHMEMKDFLRNCITANLDDKFRLEDVNHPSFTPHKTMLTDDLREKLHVN